MAHNMRFGKIAAVTPQTILSGTKVNKILIAPQTFF